MDELIEALTIFRKYTDARWPTACEHDMLYVCGVPRELVSDEDNERLEQLHFVPNDVGGYESSWFGSC